MMYAYAKSLGNDIKPSDLQSNSGIKMWKKWGSDAAHLVGEQGVAEEVNPEILSTKNSLPTENITMGDYEFNARIYTGELGNPGLQIRAYDPNKPQNQLIGHADFIVLTDKKGNTWLESDDTSVNPSHQGKGVAAMMYAFAKSLGNDIKPSDIQEPPGEKMWKKWGKDAKNLVGEQGVAEEVNPDVTSDEYFIEPTENVRMGDFVFNARTFSGGLGDPNARGLQIRAYDPKNLKGSIGSADFIVKKDKKGNTWLESDDTEVDELYRGKGVAAMMYAFAKSLGNDIKDSPYKSKAGSDMWKKWGSDAKHLVGQPGVPEDLTETTSQLGPQLYTPHPKNLDESMKPENVLWTSTASGNNNGYTSAWVRWAKNEMPGWIGHSGFLYDVSPSARILTINSDRDAMRVAKEYGLRTTDIMDLFRYMPWNKIAKDYDAIHHVPSNRGSDIFMYAWDVESTAWFNTKMLLNKRKVPIVASKQGMAE